TSGCSSGRTRRRSSGSCPPPTRRRPRRAEWRSSPRAPTRCSPCRCCSSWSLPAECSGAPSSADPGAWLLLLRQAGDLVAGLYFFPGEPSLVGLDRVDRGAGGDVRLLGLRLHVEDVEDGAVRVDER